MEASTKAMFHTHLSSIMEKLVVSAVAEIDQLLCEYCAVLRVELSGEKRQDPVDGLMRGPRDGKNGGGPRPQSDQMESNVQRRSGEDTAEEQEGGTLRLPDFKFEPINIKPEEAPEEQPELKAPPGHSPTCSEVGELPQHPDAAGQSSQICSESPEVSEGLRTDYEQSVESEHLFSFSPIGGRLTDVGFHIKREAGSPGLYTPGENIDQGFEHQMYTDSGAFPLGSTLPDTPALTCYSSSLPSENQQTSRTLDIRDLSLHGQHTADGDTSRYQGNQFESGGRSSDIAAFRASRATGRSKYMCDYCGKGFPFLSMMKGHRLSHTGERTQVCGQCGMSFIRRSHLRRHELLHSGVRPFTCQICGRKFSRSAHLNTHMKTHCR